MKVYISYSHRDKEFVHKLAEDLKKHQVDVWIDEIDINIGDNIFHKIQEGLEASEYIITVLSNPYSKSNWALIELNAFVQKEFSTDKNLIIPILLEECEIPVILRDRLYIDFRQNYEESFNKLTRALKQKQKSSTQRKPLQKEIEQQKFSSTNYQISILRDHYVKGDLTLFLGAGVSIDAGVPCWDDLLKYLLSNLFTKKLDDLIGDDGIQHKLAELYHKNFNTSPLMIAQYLKNGLGNDFLKYVRNGLYNFNPKTSKLIDTITELCRPQRARQALNSIITFNFDDLIENSLQNNSIKFKSIFKEGQRTDRTELPIYHVHGFLPREVDLTSDNEVVFSEDAYHSQFIDSFSWSNLIQLNHLNQSVCVFIGLSITDPNLRRLLDVSMRKNPDRKVNHFIFKKRYSQKEIDKELLNIGVPDKNKKNAEKFVKIVEFLEEQDANKLGLNVIWIDEYVEIPKILEKMME